MHALARSLLLAGLIPVAAGDLLAQSSLTIGARKDNTLFNQPDGLLSNGVGRYFFVGRAGFNTVAQIRRGVIGFDLSSVPVGSQVLGVELQLQMSRTTAGAVNVSLHRLLQDWGEGDSLATGNEGGGAASQPQDATWIHTFFPNSFWNAPGGDFEATASASIDVAGLGFYTWGSTPEMVSDVQAWVDDPSTSYGWLLKTAELSAFTSKRFGSRQNLNATWRPQLTVTFHPPASATRIGMGCMASMGLPLELTGRGLPSLGDQSFGLDILAGPGNGEAFLFFAFFPAQTPLQLGSDCFFYLDLVNAAELVSSGASPVGPLSLDTAGNGFHPLPIPANASIIGANVLVQALAFDSATTAGFATSNALELVIGN